MGDLHYMTYFFLYNYDDSLASQFVSMSSKFYVYKLRAQSVKSVCQRIKDLGFISNTGITFYFP